MKELENILRLWKEAEESGEAAVLVTVVKTQGSSYRLPGARLLLTLNGRRAGSVSGGCLEDDLIKKAWWLTERDPVIRRYDTTPDGEVGSGFGLGCSGVVHVLLQRLTPGDPNILDVIRETRSERHPAAVAQVISPGPMVGQKLIMNPHLKVSHNIADAEHATCLESACKLALSEGASRTVCVGKNVEAFVELLTPAVRLLIFGAGDDAVPLSELGKYLGWQVWVFDGRARYARRERFAQADEVILRSVETVGGIPKIDPWTAAVLMSHSYTQDLEMLRELSGTGLSYLGLLGPRKRALQLLSDAGIDESRLGNALHSPMGLDIGADGPEQVALSVIAEIKAMLSGRGGGLLRDRIGPIHSAEEGFADNEGVWLQSTCVQ
jgi:xanthine dehydrogenase accessory factor